MSYWNPSATPQIKEFAILNDLEYIVNTQLTYYAETGNAFCEFYPR